MITNILTGLVAFLHFYFMYLEMFVWVTPKGRKIFGQTLEQAKSSQKLAFNQGLYNGFLAAGLVWAFFESEPIFAKSIRVFFLICVIVAGLVGGWTVNKKIYFVQAVPAVLAMASVIFAL